jgi:hypothetical protein
MHLYLMGMPRLVILGMVLSFWEAIPLLISSDIGLSYDVELSVKLPGDQEPSATSSAAAESALASCKTAGAPVLSEGRRATATARR